MLLISRKISSVAVFQNDTTTFYKTTSIRILNIMKLTGTKESQSTQILKSQVYPVVQDIINLLCTLSTKITSWSSF